MSRFCILFLFAVITVNCAPVDDEPEGNKSKERAAKDNPLSGIGSAIGSLTGNNNNKEAAKEGPLGGIGNAIGTLTGNNNNKKEPEKDNNPLSGLGNAFNSLTGSNQNSNGQNPLAGLFGSGSPFGGLPGSNLFSKMQLYFGGNMGVLIPMDAIPSAFMQTLSNLANLQQAASNPGEAILKPIQNIGNAITGNKS
ncbi:putative uncharacterized protein DDB_G0286901 [Aethina tumida]|uniref:putative uncharacterized protein DDB_G0286901 n=1 Tax=Aethina tumida TaxID=116153 RepID=UPI002149290A|nr:putative uncharacterized protein DDB_G0286901 [Aethina tumida]